MSEQPLHAINDPYAQVDAAADLVLETALKALDAGEGDQISDQAIVKLMTAATKLYAEKAASRADPFRPLLGNYDETVTATEVLTTAIELLRALNLGPMELGLWSHRKPRDYCYEGSRFSATDQTEGQEHG